MRRRLLVGPALLAAALLLVVGVVALTAGTAEAGKPGGCATIQGGTITDSGGNALTVGFDEFGYNYQAHIFVGTYDSSDRVLDGTYLGTTADWVDDELIMKWSNDWLANIDCDGDGKLDRGFGTDTNDISRGWLTNEVWGDYDSDGDGTQDAHYTVFEKIVWVGPGGSLWGQYEIIMEVINDPSDGYYGLQLMNGAPGFGLNDGWTTN